MKNAIQYLLKGLAILLPIVVTIAVVHWLLVTIETWLRPLWVAILGDQYYFPGLAFVSFLVIAAIIGFSARWTFINNFWMLPGKIMEHMPLLRSLYGTITDIFDLMGGEHFAEESVVLVTLPGSELRILGIVTKKSGDKDDRLSSLLKDEEIAVFLPMAYNVGGYMIMVPMSCVEPVDMSPADAMQLTISAGIGKSRNFPSPTKKEK